MTKIDIISGFLGAGKTTLIKKLIKEGFNGEKLVLIENEFGEIGIDGGFLKEGGVEITEMNSGCICCSLVGDFGAALKDVLENYKPDRVIIEPSGVGKLSDVIKAVQNVDEGMDVVLNARVAVVDALKCKMYMKNFGEFFNNQIESASSIILSRTQKVSEAKLEECVKMIKEHNNQAAIVTTSWDDITGAKLLEVIEAKHSLEMELMKEEEVCPSCGHVHHHDHDHECCGHDHDHDHDHDDEEGHDHDHDEDEHDGHNHSSTDIEYDEHVWTSPLNAIKIVKKINAELDKIDSKNADTFDNNAEKYISEIKDIDSQIRDIVKHAKRKTLVFGDRFPFKYFVEEYGLDYKAAFPGCSDEMEPSAETVSYLVNFIRKENIPVVLYVELSNQKVADTLSNETGTKTMCLNSAHNLSQQDFDKGVTYVSIMKENIKTLKAALQ